MRLFLCAVIAALCAACSGRTSDDPVTHERDEMQTMACSPLVFRGCLTGRLGICASGMQRCARDGQRWDRCLPTTIARADVCGDGIDNDCDGTADEDCACAAGAVQRCLTGLPGICMVGTMTCSADGSGYGPCMQSISGSPEVCDQRDNDCDGVVDEDCR